MDEQEFLNRIVQSMNESEEYLLRSLGRPSSRATREQAIKQVAMIADISVDVAAPAHDFNLEELYHAIEEDVKAIYAE